MLKPLLIAAFETALNRYLSLDDNRNDLLFPLIGKVVAVTIQPVGVTLYLCPNADNIQIIDHLTGVPDTTISGTVWALGLMGVSKKPMRSVFSGEITIEGDALTGKLFQELFKKLEFDLEKVLAQYMGETLASGFSRMIRSGEDWGRESVETFKLNAAEFLQEETRDLPAKPEIDIFYEEVDNLRSSCDRLQSRIERINKIQTTK